jgi:hypothetical protein
MQEVLLLVHIIVCQVPTAKQASVQAYAALTGPQL